MLIPWKVDVPQDRLPFVNWIIIIITVAVFVVPMVLNIQIMLSTPSEVELSKIAWLTEISEIANSFVLKDYSLKGLLGHIWLHGGILHIFGNMLFLWIFGNAICAKIGNVFYLPIYLFLGIVAGCAHLFFNANPAIGASGAINGIIGMYLVFFPLNEITCVFLFFIPLMVRPYAKTFSVSSFWVIMFWLAFDIWGVIKGKGHIAYFAHLGGFFCGFGLGILMLKTKWIQMERYEKSLLQILHERKNPAQDSSLTADQRFVNLPEYRAMGALHVCRWIF